MDNRIGRLKLNIREDAIGHAEGANEPRKPVHQGSLKGESHGLATARTGRRVRRDGVELRQLLPRLLGGKAEDPLEEVLATAARAEHGEAGEETSSRLTTELDSLESEPLLVGRSGYGVKSICGCSSSCAFLLFFFIIIIIILRRVTVI